MGQVAVGVDVDGDGYGDATQDSCPTSVTIHEGPCPQPAGGGPGGGGGAGNGTDAPTTKRLGAPAIKRLTVKPKRFRAKPLGHAPVKGAWGTKLKLDLSTAATVNLWVESKPVNACGP
jgi:hypothetical protein